VPDLFETAMDATEVMSTFIHYWDDTHHGPKALIVSMRCATPASLIHSGATGRNAQSVGNLARNLQGRMP
jgi:hypothetical protein